VELNLPSRQTAPEQLIAFDGLVAIVEPPVSLLDWRLYVLHLKVNPLNIVLTGFTQTIHLCICTRSFRRGWVPYIYQLFPCSKEED
jgi:hypothetical protein